MNWESLVEWLYSVEKFQIDRRSALLKNTANEFDLACELEETDWKYLLECASFLISCPRDDLKYEGLTFATTSITQLGTNETYIDNSERDPSIGAAAMELLSRLNNIPAQLLALKKGIVEEDYFKRLPFSIQIEALRRETESCLLLEKRAVLLNEFQSAFWKGLNSGSNKLSVSAPTSTGKSFLIKLWIEMFISQYHSCNIVYIAPTRALVQEVSIDLEQNFRDIGLSGEVFVSASAPVSGTGPKVFVVTQERCLQLLESKRIDEIHAFIVDEAHKIEDSTRGVLLDYVLTRMEGLSPSAFQLFLSPTISNPEIFVDNQVEKTVLSTRSVVLQNLIWVDAIPYKPLKWRVSLVDGGDLLEVGTLTLSDRPQNSGFRRLAFIAATMGNGSEGNLVYANGAAETEKISVIIAELNRDHEHVDEDVKASRRELAAFISKILHPSYVLVTVVADGVGIHYGDLPLVVKSAIEDAFREGVLKYLICTSTLTEGVNLPCRNIFIRSPKRGNRKPMSEEDFWNLAGRAGRWGMEFQGNVVCVDPQKDGAWRMVPPRKKQFVKIQKGTSVTASRWNEVIAELDSKPETTSEESNHLLSSLVGLIVDHNVSESTIISKLSVSQEQIDLVKQKIETYSVPTSVLRGNPGIAPWEIESLYNGILGIDDLVEITPTFPEDERARDAYFLILNLINRHVEKNFGNDARLKGLVNTMCNWMNGIPLALMIKRKQGFNEADVNKYVRLVLSDIEQYIRFRIPRVLRLYVDLLTIVAEERRYDLPSMPDLWSCLEFGQSSATAIALMTKGVSRFGASNLAEIITDSNLEISQIEAWLKDGDRWKALPLSSRVKNELVFAFKLE